MASVPREPTFLDPHDKIWQRYIATFEERNDARVEQWKGNAEGILIFTGLFSATVATFLANSLSMLSPDTGGQTVELLNQVLVVLSNGSDTSSLSGSAPIPAAFEVSTPAFLVNLLWIISLFVSLSSALGAILVQQWMRTYVHDAHRHPDPSKRGLAFSALALGVKRFRMEDTVTAIMVLLHVSVLLFCVGMLVLLYSIHTIIAGVLTALLAAGLLVYVGFTLMPIFWHDTPYHTPIGQLVMFILKIASQGTHFFVMLALDPIYWKTNMGWFNNLYEFIDRLPVPRPKRAYLTSSTSMDDIPRQTRFTWHSYAFKHMLELADELPKMLDFWEAFSFFLSSSKVDHDIILSLVPFALDWEGLTLSSRFRTMLHSLRSLDDGVRYFGRTTLVLCSLAREMLAAFPIDDDKDSRKVLYALYYPPEVDWSTDRLDIAEAFALFEAELRAIIFTRALGNRSWLEHQDCGRLFRRLDPVDGLNLDRSKSFSESQIQICLIENFIRIYGDVLRWIDVLGSGHVLASLKQTSWLLPVQNTHAAALSVSRIRDVVTSFVEVAQSSPGRLRGDTKLMDLLSTLGVSDYRTLELKKDTGIGSPSQMHFNTIRSKYRSVFNAYPEFADMLYTLCAALLEVQHMAVPEAAVSSRPNSPSAPDHGIIDEGTLASMTPSLSLANGDNKAPSGRARNATADRASYANFPGSPADVQDSDGGKGIPLDRESESTGSILNTSTSHAEIDPEGLQGDMPGEASVHSAVHRQSSSATTRHEDSVIVNMPDEPQGEASPATRVQMGSVPATGCFSSLPEVTGEGLTRESGRVQGDDIV